MSPTLRCAVVVLLAASCNKADEPSPKGGGVQADPGTPAPEAPPAGVTITNSCSTDIWIASTPNAGAPPLPDGIVKLAAGGGSHAYDIPADGWAGRFWPKTGCDDSGENCSTGQAVPPCPPNGCQPPADTKIEFYFGEAGGSSRPFYDVSLVDGYSLPAKIVPSTSGGRCTPTSCALDLAACPAKEIDGVGDLRIKDGRDVVQCFAPCKKWTWPTPLGDGGSEGTQPGIDMCCPNPPVSPMQCRAGQIEQTKYVALVRKECPTAYSYSFDDKGGSHDCDPGTTFAVTFCPQG